MNKKLTVKKFCILSLLTAITAILSIYCTFRIGTTIKIPFKFISVYITASIMGPVWGGIVAVLGDLLNVFLVPTGQWLPPITAIEFINGFIFGVLFYNRSYHGKKYILRVLVCTILLFIIDILLTSFILTKAGYFPTYFISIISRLPAGIIKALIHGIFLLISPGYTNKFKALAERL